VGGRWVLVLCIAGCGRVDFELHGVADAPADAAPPANFAFVTSTKQLPTTFGSDLAGADAICNTRATQAGLLGTYVAWLSSTTMPAVNRLGGARGWIRTDGLP
jgi:hypothetical protein